MEDVSLGQIVHSKAGRDKNKYFVVVRIIDENYVLIADGELRLIDNPKKKKIKHLVFHDLYVENILEKLKGNLELTNSDIRKSLKSLGLL